MHSPRIFAVVPAAGFSRRMGQPKLLLPFGSGTVISCVMDALKAGGVDEIYLLVRADDVDLRRELNRHDVCIVPTPEPTAGMRESVELLLTLIAVEMHPEPEDAWLLVPADEPTLDPQVVRGLVAEWRAAPTGILVPVHRGRRGHPTLFGWNFTEYVYSLPEGQGLNRLLRIDPGEVREIPVASPEILQDMDTPEDYQRLKLSEGDG